MKINSGYEIREAREMNKISLDTFTHQRTNVLDYPIDKLIEDLKSQIKTLYSENSKLVELQKRDPGEFKKQEEKENERGSSLHLQMYVQIVDIQYLENELFALFEMKIIYAFKHFEINIKQLLSTAYDDDYINRQFKWDSIIQFLNSKDIESKKLNEYETVNQLRNLNNSLKHSSKIIDQGIKNIEEFKNKDTFTYLELEAFYIRIEKAPNAFLMSLASAVFNDLYVFKSDRILTMAKSLALRMDGRNASDFSKELLKLYK